MVCQFISYPNEWHLIFLSRTIECDVPVHINDHYIQWNIAFLIASHDILNTQSINNWMCVRGYIVTVLPFPQCHHMPSIENRKLQKHILVEWEFDRQPVKQ